MNSPAPALRNKRRIWPRWVADAGLRLAFGQFANRPRNHRMMGFWLEAGANPNAPRFSQGDSWLFLHVAAEEGDDRAVDLLIRHGAKLDPVSTPHRETPLAIALREKHRGCAELLTRAGANLDHACKFSFQPRRAEYTADWFRQTPSPLPQVVWGTWSSGYRKTSPAKGSMKSARSMHAPAPQVHIDTLQVGCVDNARAMAFAQGGECRPTVRQLMHNLGWENLIDVHQACAQARELSAAWTGTEEPVKVASRPRL
jgi:hypothetical protein